MGAGAGSLHDQRLSIVTRGAERDQIVVRLHAREGLVRRKFAQTNRHTRLVAIFRDLNPADVTQSYVVGKGKPPHWFVALRDKGRLPAPVPSDSPKPKEV